jgi:hypothetical protein
MSIPLHFHVPFPLHVAAAHFLSMAKPTSSSYGFIALPAISLALSVVVKPALLSVIAIIK